VGAGLKTLFRTLLLLWFVGISIAWIWARIEFPEGTLQFGVALILVLAVGAFLTVKVRGNLLGPLLVVGATAGLVYDVGTAYAEFSLGRITSLPLEHFAAWLGTWTGPIGFLTVSVLFVLFPEGRFVGKRRWFIPFLCVPAVLTIVGSLALWSLSTADLVALSSSSNPSEIFPEYAMVNLGFILSGIPLMIPSAISLFVRYWKSGPVERLQIKWLAASAVFAPLFIVTTSQVFPSAPETIVSTIGLSTLPLSIAVAVTRYRLYDLGRVISRTVSYAIIVAVLGSLFVVGVVAVPNLVIGTTTAPPLVVAASTLAVAALFNPMRKRVQAWLDRRFNRSQYDAQRVVDEFAGSLRDRVEVRDLIVGWTGAVSHTMQPSAIGVWVRD
jgi:hypothetical protein